MKKEIVTRNGNPLELTKEKIELIKRTVAKGATDDELAMFFHIAKEYSLDPFMRELQFYKQRQWNQYANRYDETPVMLTGHAGLLSIAHRTGQFGGMESDIIYDKEGKIDGAWATVWNKSCEHPIKVKIKFSEYCRMIKGKPMASWASKPETMAKKVAECHALRRAFNIRGLYSYEEMESEIHESAPSEIEHAATAIETSEKLYANPDEYKKFSEDLLTRILDSIESAQDPEELYRIEKSFKKEISKLNESDREYASMCFDSARESLINGQIFDRESVIGDHGSIMDHIKKDPTMPEISPEMASVGTKPIEKDTDPAQDLATQEKADKEFIQKAVGEVKDMTTALQMKTWLNKNKPRIKTMLKEYSEYLENLFKGKWEKALGNSQLKYKWI